MQNEHADDPLPPTSVGEDAPVEGERDTVPRARVTRRGLLAAAAASAGGAVLARLPEQ